VREQVCEARDIVHFLPRLADILASTALHVQMATMKALHVVSGQATRERTSPGDSVAVAAGRATDVDKSETEGILRGLQVFLEMTVVLVKCCGGAFSRLRRRNAASASDIYTFLRKVLNTSVRTQL
jgi:hypothetical protein